MKNSFELAKLQDGKDFKRDTGMSLNNFITIVNLVQEYLKKIYEKNPNKLKGQKPSIILEDKVLLTLYYFCPSVL